MYVQTFPVNDHHESYSLKILPYMVNKTSVSTFLPWKLPVLCMMTTLNGAHQTWNSLTHWCRTVAGHTINTGPSPRHLEWNKMHHQSVQYTTCNTHRVTLLYNLLTFSPARNAIIWIVLPRPISSPTMPPACWPCNSHSHCTPVLWYLWLPVE